MTFGKDIQDSKNNARNGLYLIKSAKQNESACISQAPENNHGKVRICDSIPYYYDFEVPSSWIWNGRDNKFINKTVKAAYEATLQYLTWVSVSNDLRKETIDSEGLSELYIKRKLQEISNMTNLSNVNSDDIISLLPIMRNDISKIHSHAYLLWDLASGDHYTYPYKYSTDSICRKLKDTDTREITNNFAKNILDTQYRIEDPLDFGFSHPFLKGDLVKFDDSWFTILNIDRPRKMNTKITIYDPTPFTEKENEIINFSYIDYKVFDYISDLKKSIFDRVKISELSASELNIQNPIYCHSSRSIS